MSNSTITQVRKLAKPFYTGIDGRGKVESVRFLFFLHLNFFSCAAFIYFQMCRFQRIFQNHEFPIFRGITENNPTNQQVIFWLTFTTVLGYIPERLKDPEFILHVWKLCVVSFSNQTEKSFPQNWMHLLIEDTSTVILKKKIIQISRKLTKWWWK